MQQKCFGYRSSGVHVQQPLTHEESIFMGLMWEHVGLGNKISANELAVRFFTIYRSTEVGSVPQFVETLKQAHSNLLADWKREIRKMHNHLVMDHDLPILSAAGYGGGYWMAEHEGEAEDFYNAFKRRGLTGLVKATRGKQASVVELMTQLSFEWGDDLLASTPASDAAAPPSVTMPIQIVDKFLEQILADPDRYAAGIARLRKKFGQRLIDDEQIQAIKTQVATLTQMAAGL